MWSVERWWFIPSMYATLVRIFSEKEIRGKLLFIFGALVAYRVAAVIPLPGVDVLRLQRFFDENQFLGLLNVFSGGGLSNVSIVLLGVAPYITASRKRVKPVGRSST